MIQVINVGKAGLNQFFTEELSVLVNRMVNTMPEIAPAVLKVSWWANGRKKPATVIDIVFKDDSIDGRAGNFVRKQWAQLKIDEFVGYESLPIGSAPKPSCLSLNSEDGCFLIACAMQDNDVAEAEIEREIAAAIAVMHEIIDPTIARSFVNDLKLSPRRLKTIKNWLKTSDDKAAQQWRGDI